MSIRGKLTKVFGATLLVCALSSANNSVCYAKEISDIFDTKQYADTYQDLKDAYGYDADALLNHYFTHGINEGRVMVGDIDLKIYKSNYADLSNSFGDDWRAYAEHYVNYGISEGRNGKTTQQIKETNTATVNIDYNSLVVKDDAGVSDAYYNSVVNYWGRVPAGVKDSFARDGWVVHVRSGKLTLPGYTSGILSICSFERKEILVGTRQSYSLLHEVGHYVDYKHGFCHNSIPDDVWQSEIGAAKRLGGGSGSNYANKQEYFAECFGLYLLKPAEFRSACPQTTAFIESHML